MKLSFLLGLDIGTSGAKAILINNDGVVIASAITEYPMYTPQPLWTEQNPEDWWNATVESIRKVISISGIKSSEIVSIGLTGQMHGLVLLDKHGQALRPCILWNDQRTQKQCDLITEIIGREKLLELTGNPVLPGFTAPKILWVRVNEPEVYSKINKILLPKDYIRYRLTNEFFSDVSDASGTSMFDVKNRVWSDDVLHEIQIAKEWLPDVTESFVASAKMSNEAAQVTGLLEGTLVVAGAGDQAAQAIGTGITSEGIVSVTIGTSGVVFAASNEYRIDPEGRLHSFCHAVQGMWHLMGVMLSAGGSFRWYRDTMCESEIARAKKLNIDPYELMTVDAAKISPGSDGLIFLPYLSGERTPYPDPNARGVFFGFTLRHTKAHLTRAVMEGVTFGLRDSLELIKNCGIKINQVRASGGGAKSEMWLQMLSDIFDTEIVTVNVSEGAAYGAALLAGVGAGVFQNVKEASERVIKTTSIVHPIQSTQYKNIYPRYRALYHALKNEFKEISKVVTQM